MSSSFQIHYSRNLVRMATVASNVYSKDDLDLWFDILPDDKILKILSHLKSDDIFRISKVNPTVGRVALDWSLWRRTVFDEPISLSDLNVVADKIWTTTRVL